MSEEKALVLASVVFMGALAYIYGGIYGLIVMAVIFGRVLWGGDFG
jgi:hypothetical protein